MDNEKVSVSCDKVSEKKLSIFENLLIELGQVLYTQNELLARGFLKSNKILGQQEVTPISDLSCVKMPEKGSDSIVASFTGVIKRIKLHNERLYTIVNQLEEAI